MSSDDNSAVNHDEFSNLGKKLKDPKIKDMIQMINTYDEMSDTISQNFAVSKNGKRTKKKKKTKEKNEFVLVDGVNIKEDAVVDAPNLTNNDVGSAQYISDNTMSCNEFDDFEKNFAIRDQESELKLINNMANSTASKGASNLVICGRN